MVLFHHPPFVFDSLSIGFNAIKLNIIVVHLIILKFYIFGLIFLDIVVSIRAGKYPRV
jgi:hypothetical protein